MSEHARAGPSSPYGTPEHEAWREIVRRLVARAIEPFARSCRASAFARELCKRAAAISPQAGEIMNDLSVR